MADNVNKEVIDSLVVKEPTEQGGEPTFEVKVNGKTETVTLDDLKKNYSLGKGAQARLQQAAEFENDAKTFRQVRQAFQKFQADGDVDAYRSFLGGLGLGQEQVEEVVKQAYGDVNDWHDEKEAEPLTKEDLSKFEKDQSEKQKRQRVAEMNTEIDDAVTDSLDESEILPRILQDLDEEAVEYHKGTLKEQIQKRVIASLREEIRGGKKYSHRLLDRITHRETEKAVKVLERTRGATRGNVNLGRATGGATEPYEQVKEPKKPKRSDFQRGGDYELAMTKYFVQLDKYESQSKGKI
jgi:hypothetical protein